MKIYIRRAKEGIWNKSVKFGNTFCYTAAALVLPSFAFAFTPTYTLTDLGILPGTTESQALRLNNRGDAIGVGEGNQNKAILFHNGKVVNLTPTSVSSSASGINASSQVTGTVFTGSANVGFIYKNGVAVRFNVPGATETVGWSLNDVGQTAGDYSPANTPINSADHIFVKQPNGTFSDLGNFGIDPSALSINNQGRVLIGSWDGVRTHTFISRPGSTSMEEIPSLVPHSSVSPGEMNQYSVVTGWATTDILGTHQRAYIYANGKIKNIGGLSGATDSWGFGINNLGQVCGQSFTASKQVKDSTGKIIQTPEINAGFVDLDGTLRDVNKLMDQSGKGWVISRAQSINDLDQVLADANFNGGPTHAVNLTPNAVLPNLVP
jgi:uncharacterized membrane protein